MKKIIIIALVMLAVPLYLFVGYISTNSLLQDIEGKTGEVWNSVDRAIQVLDRLEGQMEVYLADRQDLIDQITAARNDILAAKENGNLATLTDAQNKTEIAVQAIAEAYPDISLSGLQQGLMDETAGSLNRISYARKELIETQVKYNKATVWFPFYPKVEVLGSSFNPETTLPPSTFGN